MTGKSHHVSRIVCFYACSPAILPSSFQKVFVDSAHAWLLVAMGRMVFVLYSARTGFSLSENGRPRLEIGKVLNLATVAAQLWKSASPKVEVTLENCILYAAKF